MWICVLVQMYVCERSENTLIDCTLQPSGSGASAHTRQPGIAKGEGSVVVWVIMHQPTFPRLRVVRPFDPLPLYAIARNRAICNRLGLRLALILGHLNQVERLVEDNHTFLSSPEALKIEA